MTGQNTFEGDKTKRNARSLQLTHIQYRADKSLVKEANRRCKLECAGESRLCQSAYTKEERLKLALEFLEKRGGYHKVQLLRICATVMADMWHIKRLVQLQSFDYQLVLQM